MFRAEAKSHNHRFVVQLDRFHVVNFCMCSTAAFDRVECHQVNGELLSTAGQCFKKHNSIDFVFNLCGGGKGAETKAHNQ